MKFDDSVITEDKPSTEDKSNTYQPQHAFVASENNACDYKKKSITDLHPSWQAKQKIKPIIQEFKGKKITFDE